MTKSDFLSKAFVFGLLFCVTGALDICAGNKCKNGAHCVPLDNDEYKCQCNNGYKGAYCEDKSEFCLNHQCKNGATCLNLDDGYKCQCLNGWEGKKCQFNVDDCAQKPCKNGGVCRDLNNHKYLCTCPANFIGMSCEYNNPCAEANPCGVNGKCLHDNIGGYKCHCSSGFTGPACSIDIDECVQYSTGLCENGGKCINTVGSYRCECAKGYSGERCANDIIDCTNETCKNGATCLDKIGHYKCVCTEYFEGDNCEIPISICAKRPCKNNGICRDYGKRFRCICPNPWTGETCEKALNPCSENPCVNGGICEEDGVDSFKCMCKSGYTGKLCERNIDDCLDITCQNKGICVDLIDSWNCKCARGFSGRYCEINIDDCKSNPCRNQAPCVDLIADYKCQCPPGLTGKNCEINIDDCASHPCANGGRCEDRVGGFTCHCLMGFVGLTCESKSDICAQLLPCKNGGVCSNDPTANGGYVCSCPSGMNTKDCSNEISKCVTVKCASGGRCIDERCVCSPGFSGSSCDIDINECRNNPCQHDGTCQDLVNDYLCHCPSGFKGKNCETNINECANNPCGANGICVDEVSGYRCKCFVPFYGPTCSSKSDPCKFNDCTNEAICVPTNDYKTYYCNCSTAYGIFAGRYCDEDVNECLLNITDIIPQRFIGIEDSKMLKGPCLNSGACINTKGSFICKCASGYEGKYCQINTDDCAKDPCKNGARCDDLVNGYRCHCRSGFGGDNCEIEINECDRNPCLNGAQCDDHVNDYLCHCLPGFSGKNCEINDDDCTEQSCSGHGTCLDKTNDFECQCQNGFSGQNCEHLQQPCDSSRCQNNGSCVNRITTNNEPGYLCNCRRGYSGPSCDIRMDWCRGSPCGEKGICISDIDGFRCKCADGFIGDRCEIQKTETCQTYALRRYQNESLINQICYHNGFCFNQPEIGGFKCSCPSGYRGTFCNENIDDCANQPCLNGGECNDGVGMYRCNCLLGFQGVNCQVNFNDCSSEPCNRGRCVDQINNYTCICPRGTSGRSCELIKDNCKDVKCFNGGECRSLLGDFNCQCKKGFIGKFCEVDLNECRYSINGLLLNKNEKPYGPCSPSGTVSCLDGHGDFKCLCRPGFTGRYCQTRMDSCEDMRKKGQIPCFNGGACINDFHRTNVSQNSFRCLCPAGFGSDRCQHYNKRCQVNLCQNGGVCRPVASGDKMSFVCDCPPGVGGLFCEQDFVNECDTTMCYNGGHCLDGFGKAICRCTTGFCGERCEIGDVSACNSTTMETGISYTDELAQCNRHRCSTKINNKRCDLECNHLACRFDSGECLHKVPKSVGGVTVELAQPWSNCTVIKTHNIPCHHWFMNGRCDPQCNIESCLFDGWDCEKTVTQCPEKAFCDSHYGDNHCQLECNTIECDFDGGDCLQSQNSTISGAIVLVLPVTTTVFVSVWQSKLLQSLTHLLHSIVRVKKEESGIPMIFPIRVFVENVRDEGVVRHKRATMLDDFRGKPGTKVYLEVDNSACKSTNNMCFDNSKAAAEFVSAALHSRSYRPPIPILSVQADSVRPYNKDPTIIYRKNMLIYVILVMTCLIVLGILVGVLYGLMQNKGKSDPKTKKAETWFPEGMKRLNQSTSHYHHRRLGISNRKRNQNALNGLNPNSELGNVPQMTKSKISASDSIDDSGSNSLTSTRVTSYENNNDTNNENMSSENCMLLSNGDINCKFPPEKRLKLHMDSNKYITEQSNLESWCFNAFVQLLVSGNGLGELTANDCRDKQIIMEKLFHIAANNNETNDDNPNMFTDVPNKKELTNSSLASIITARVPYSGETLLHLAAKFNRKEAARFLLETGSDPNKEDANGRSCLLTAIDASAVEVATYILEQQSFPIDIHQKGPGGATCLIQAVKGAHAELIHIILQHTQPEECDLNVTDDYGRTALHWAAATNQIGIVQLLMSYGLNRDAQDNEEMTPLYLASREGCYEVCKVLIANGANPDMSDHLDRLPRDIAKANHFDDIIALLDDYVNLTKENQQHRPMMWGQYNYYSNNYYCPSHPMDLKSVLYASPHSVNQLSCCVYPTVAHNSSLATGTHSNHPCYRDSHNNYSTPLNEPVKKRNHPSHINNHNSHHSNTNPELKYNKPQKLSPTYYKDMGNYFDYCATPNVHRMANFKSLVANNNSMLVASSANCSAGYPSNNNPTSSTSAPGITPSPDSDSPGHWSTSSPSLSPRSKNQQQQRTMPLVNQQKSSVLHYHPTNDTNVDCNHPMNGLQNNELYSFHQRNNVCRY